MAALICLAFLPNRCHSQDDILDLGFDWYLLLDQPDNSNDAFSSRGLAVSYDQVSGNTHMVGYYDHVNANSTNSDKRGIIYSVDNNEELKWTLHMIGGGNSSVTDVWSNDTNLYVTGLYTANFEFHRFVGSSTSSESIFYTADNNSAPNESTAFIASLDPNTGDVLWFYLLGGTMNDGGMSISSNNGIVYSVIAFDNSNNDMTIPNGDPNIDDYTVPEVQNTGSIINGYGGSNSYALIALDGASGDYQWHAFVGSQDNDFVSSSSYWFTRNFRATDLHCSDEGMFLIYLSRTDDSIHGSDGNPYFYGGQPLSPDRDVMVAEFDYTGIPQWKRYFIQDDNNMFFPNITSDCNGLYLSFSGDTDEKIHYESENGDEVFETSDSNGYRPLIFKLDKNDGYATWLHYTNSSATGRYASPVLDMSADGYGSLYLCGTLEGSLTYNEHLGSSTTINPDLVFGQKNMFVARMQTSDGKLSEFNLMQRFDDDILFGIDLILDQSPGKDVLPGIVVTGSIEKDPDVIVSAIPNTHDQVFLGKMDSEFMLFSDNCCDTASVGTVTDISDEQLCAGKLITLTTTGSSGELLWQYQLPNENTWTNVAPANDELTFTVSDPISYRLLASGECGTCDSSDVILIQPIVSENVGSICAAYDIELVLDDCEMVAPPFGMVNIPDFSGVCSVENVSYTVNSSAEQYTDIELSEYQFTSTNGLSPHEVTANVHTADGSLETCSFLVDVVTTAVPSFSGCDSTLRIAATNNCFGSLPEEFPFVNDWTAADCHGDAINSFSSDALADHYSLGVNTIELTFAGDDAELTCPVFVEVVDESGPVLQNCPGNGFVDVMPVDESNDCLASIAVTIAVSDCNPVTADVSLLDESGTVVLEHQSNVALTGAAFDKSGTVLFSNHPVGLYTVQYTVTDSLGNASEVCSYLVSLEDTTHPVLESCATDTFFNVNDFCSYNFNQDTDLSMIQFSEACGSLTYSYELDSAGITIASGMAPFVGNLSLGSYFFRSFATNDFGLSEVCETNITIQDNTLPQLECPENDVTLSLPPTSCYASFSSLSPTQLDDNCTYYSRFTVLDDSNTNVLFQGELPIPTDVELGPGVYIVQFEASNDATFQTGLVECSYSVFVIDPHAPTIECPADITVVADALINNNCSVTVTHDLSPTPTDNCENYTVEYTINGINDPAYTGSASGQEFSYGVNELNYIVVDHDSNQSAECQSSVTVTDTVNLQPICPGTQHFSLTNSCSIDINLYSEVIADSVQVPLRDNCPSVAYDFPLSWERYDSNGQLIDFSNDYSVSNSFGQGLTEIVVFVQDQFGNQQTCNFDVIVNDTSPPVALCYDSLNIELTSSSVSIEPILVDSGSTDNCAITDWALSQSTFTSVGVLPVTMTLTDASSQASSCSSIITVSDLIPPSAICISDTTFYLNSLGEFDLSAVPDSVFGPESYDNSGELTYNVADTVFYCDNVGTHGLWFYVTDNNGNQDSCMVNITIENSQAPIINCVDTSINTGQCEETIPFSIEELTHNCDINTNDISWSISSLGLSGNGDAGEALFPLGTHEVVWTLPNPYSDVTGTSTVFVIDTVAPVILCDPEWTFCMDQLGNYEAAAPVVQDAGCNELTAFPSVAIEDIDASTESIVWIANDGFQESQCITELNITPLATQAHLSESVLTLDSEYEINALNANEPSVGVGVWTVDHGSGVLDNANDPQTAIHSLSPGENMLTWTITNDGCGDNSQELTIEVNSFHIPNAFSPNGDLTNERFVIRGILAYPDNQFEVFNRWGISVFQSTGYKNDWNGLDPGGSPLPTDTYFYVLKVNGLNETNVAFTTNGFIELKR